ncbi:MAG TPA: DNA replication complex GINS family protein [Nanoarchaeota archaeon]|nr:DNA replication complex GINS family protein [Nanoarchaeota archaeon]
MEVITFEFIREVHRRERESKSLDLQELPENFFSLVQKWLTEKEKVYEAEKNPSVLIEIENAKKLLREIISQRQKKIVISALHVLRGGTPPENMLPQEEEFFEKVLNLLNEYKSMIELEITGDFVKDKIQEIKENLQELSKDSSKESEKEEKEKEQKEEKKEFKAPTVKLIKVVALNNIPRFVDENLNPYGPYKKGEVFELPEELAKILISRKIVERVEE